MVNPRPDRLEDIATRRGTDPDIRWLLDEVMRLRDELDAEHAAVLAVAVRLQEIVRQTGQP